MPFRSKTVQEQFQRGIALFNQCRFFEAHEVWEDIWRALKNGKRRQTLQALIQSAVAAHQLQTFNLHGAKSSLQKALRKLRPDLCEFQGVDLKRLRKDLADISEALSGGATPDFISLKLRTRVK
jgi:predicted metal-dependent hydrolase